MLRSSLLPTITEGRRGRVKSDVWPRAKTWANYRFTCDTKHHLLVDLHILQFLQNAMWRLRHWCVGSFWLNKDSHWAGNGTRGTLTQGWFTVSLMTNWTKPQKHRKPLESNLQPATCYPVPMPSEPGMFPSYTGLQVDVNTHVHTISCRNFRFNRSQLPRLI